MAENLPNVTIVIAARPGQSEIKAVTGARALHYPPERLELIVARGRQPSAQRNAALGAACGEWIYFLDDDSVPEERNLERATPHLHLKEIKMLGGPNVCPQDAPWLEQVFALVLGSWLAFGPSRARYTPVGQTRSTSEKELILCNLFARRAEMLELGGFNEALYPNEENALMDELQKRGGKLLYDPDLIVYRRPRSSLQAFAKMLMTYGRGRAEQFRLHPTAGSLLNFVPPLFCIYVLLVIGILVFAPKLAAYFLALIALYLLAVLAQAIALLPKPRKPSSKPIVLSQSTQSRYGFWARVFFSLAAIPLIVITNLLYGTGFWRGLFTRLKPNAQSKAEVVLETLKELGSPDWRLKKSNESQGSRPMTRP